MKIVTFQDRIKLAQDVIYSVAALPKDHHYMQGSGMDLANIAREEAAMEETFTNINQETIKKIIDPLTLRFRSRRIEEHYESTMLAPNRLVKLQLGTPQIFFFYCLVVYPYLIFMNGLNITMDYRFYTWMILVAILTMWMTIAHYDQGILFARLWYATTGSRMFTRMLLLSLAWTLALDFCLGRGPSDVVGPTVAIHVLYVSLTSGISATFVESVCAIVVVCSIAVVKCVFIYNANSYSGVIMYALPVVLAVTMGCGYIRSGDMDKRMRYIKGRFVQERLKLLQQERDKTDHILAMSLPQTIVTRLRDIGTDNFDLIAERIKSSSIMFGDLKNFKQIMHDLGSIKDAVILLNSVFETMDAVMQRYIYIEKIKTIQSKILLVGGLDGVNCRIRRMVDMALTLRNIFAQPYQFETETESRTVNLNVAFGIEMGPIVAGIVGKKKFWYEVYGDVVNTASRMLAQAKGGQIIVTEKVWSTVNDRFRGISLGERAVKGKGIVTIYSIQGLTPEAQREHDEAEEILSDIDMDAVYTVTGSKENLGEDRPRSRSGTKVGFSDSGTVGRKSTGGRSRRSVRVAPLPAAQPPLPPIPSQKRALAIQTRAESFSRNLMTSPIRYVPPLVTDHPPIEESPEHEEQSLGDECIASDSDDLIARSLASQCSTPSPSSPTFPQTTATTPQVQPVAVTSFTSRDRRKTLYGSLMESDINTQRRASDADTTIIKINNQTHEKKFERVDDEKENADKVRGAISDVIVKLCNGIDLSGDAEEVYSLYLSEIYDEVKPYTLVFRDRALERAFREDYCRGTSRQFMVSTIIGLLCEIVLMALSIFSSSQIHSGVIFTSLGQFYTVLILFILSLGIQMLLTGIVMFEGDEDETRSSRGLFRTRMILFGISAATMFVMTVTVSLVWDGMWDIPFYETCVIGSITTMYIMRIDGMIFLYKFSVVAAVAPFIIIINFAERGGSNWTENLAFIGATLIWITTFHMTEHSLRAEYLLDLMLETQTEMLEKEAVKSSVVLNTILPERVSLKMLADPDAIVFDNFPAITVLHMDVAGFTAMSSDLEPLKIVKMLNTLFTYFDRLTEDYNVEKIMTIGDAYVACSTLSTFSDPKEGAISVCVVALQMQSYVANHLNKSDFVVNVVKKPLSMRIGVHTGPGYGAIMGGSRNFRYDIMGDTVTFAERVQERCPLDKVNVSCTTLELVKDYHGFEADKSMTDEVDGVATCVIAATDTRMIASNLHSFELNKTPSGSPLTRLKTSQGKGKKDSLSKLFITSNK